MALFRHVLFFCRTFSSKWLCSVTCFNFGIEEYPVGFLASLGTATYENGFVPSFFLFLLSFSSPKWLCSVTLLFL